MVIHIQFVLVVLDIHSMLYLLYVPHKRSYNGGNCKICLNSHHNQTTNYRYNGLEYCRNTISQNYHNNDQDHVFGNIYEMMFLQFVGRNGILFHILKAGISIRFFFCFNILKIGFRYYFNNNKYLTTLFLQ